ncbi:hypothetical protein NW765_003380 [Fusarium oxysporum]|nr:hypothetical protein NW765_003380 [Fusarium oxysporum]
MAPQPPGLKKPSARTLRHQRITGQIHPQAPQKSLPRRRRRNRLLPLQQTRQAAHQALLLRIPHPISTYLKIHKASKTIEETSSELREFS